MTIFKDGYYIDEFNKRLRQIVGETLLDDFYAKKLYFSISNIPEYLLVDSINPLLKVAWNIISRVNQPEHLLEFLKIFYKIIWVITI